jgi:recombination protein RecT
MSETKAVAAPRIQQFVPLGKVKSLQELFDNAEFKKRIEQAVPKHMRAERMLRTFVTAVQKTPKLMQVAPLSMLGAYITLAALGLEPNTPLQHAFLIPFDVKKWNPTTRKRETQRTDVNLIIGYPGYLELISRSGKVSDVHCDVVWPGDQFSYEYGTDRHLRHKPGREAHPEGTQPEFAYMYARMTGGGESFEVMTAADVLTIRGRSQGYRSAMYAYDDAKKEGKDPMRDPRYSEAPWIKDPVPMWRKTALRAGQKWLPKSIEMATAMALDEEGDRGHVDFSKVTEMDNVMEGTWEVTDAGDHDPEGPIEPEKPAQTPRSQVATTTAEPRQAKPPAKRQPAPPPAEDHDPRDDEVPPPGDEQEGRTAAPPSRPAQTASKADQPATQHHAPAAPAFEGYLSDETGEIVAGPFTDELAWAGAFHKLFTEAPDPSDRDAIWDSNLDVITPLRSHPTVGPMLESLGAQEQEAEGDQVAHGEDFHYGAIALPEARGKPDWKTYLAGADQFYETLARQSEQTVDGWLAAQMPTLMRAGQPQQLAVRSRIVKHCQELGVAVPECIAPLGVPEPQTATDEPAVHAALTADGASDWPPAWAKDVGHVEARLSEMRTLSNKHDMRRYFGSTPQTLLLDRLEREDKGRLATHFRVQAKAIMDAA